jgi:predicted GH43/DUF377 family glycosyl hydrolase
LSPVLAHPVAAHLEPDPARVIARLFLPGEELHLQRSRASQIVERVMSVDEAEVSQLAAQLLKDFGPRHHRYEDVLARHAAIVATHVQSEARLSVARQVLLGATFTSEYSTEGAALCNPSAVLHPDQSGVDAGQIRVAISLRAIGEGHISSITFCSALAGPGPQWVFEPRQSPATVGESSPVLWRRAHLTSVLADQGHLDELGGAVVAALPEHFSQGDLETVLANVYYDLLVRPGAATTVELLRKVVGSAYAVEFADDIALSQRVLMPTAAEESNGMEDARLTRFVGADGDIQFRATYTAYDGRQIAPRLLTSPDLRTFEANRLAGPAARNKGMALFPRLVNGRHLALCRSDGESTSLATSPDGYVWSNPETVQNPRAPWEILQIGNCGPPIETPQGWLVLTHGVGPMRAYSMGAILLDLDDPRRIVGRLSDPLISPQSELRDGYVPNVVYSCGAIAHGDTLWIPYGIDDARIAVAHVSVPELIQAMD